MAKKVLTAVKDLKIGAFVHFAVVRSYGEAERSFTTEVNNEQSMLCAHPADFQLFAVADIDEESGLVKVYGDGPRLLADGVSVKRKPAEQAILPIDGLKG